MYIYPENLNAKAMLWVWTLKDLVISGSLLLTGFLLFAFFGITLILVAGATYAFLAIRIEDTSVLDYLCCAARFCFAPRLYLWSLETPEPGKEDT